MQPMRRSPGGGVIHLGPQYRPGRMETNHDELDCSVAGLNRSASVVLIVVVVLVSAMIEDRLNRIHGALREGLYRGGVDPYLGEIAARDTDS